MTRRVVRITALSVALVIATLSTIAQTVEKDSIEAVRVQRGVALTGVPLIIGGLVVKHEDTHFRNLRNDYMPSFNRHLDDYMQYSPAAIMLAMKTLGVESRSSWGRMLTSDAMSAAIMAIVVNTLKNTTQVERPDGSNRHSFPSGHTATAFMTATMLAKEYGHVSPWIPIGGYAVASATGLFRMANNKHWLSDVMTGAGIGLLSTEIGYYLADCMFKDKGLNHLPTHERIDRWSRPSFLGLYIGINVPISSYDIDENISFRTSSGSIAGIEGAYFITPNVGVGGRFTASSTSIIVNQEVAEDKRFDTVAFSAGGYFSYPLSSHWLIGSKLLGTYLYYPRLNLSNTTVSAHSGVGIGTGVSMGFRYNKHYVLRFFLDYNVQQSHSRNTGEWMNTLAFGSAFAIAL